MQTLATTLPQPVLDQRTSSNAGSRRLYGIFRRSGQSFGLPVEFIREVVAAGEMTRLAQMPAELAGVFNLRGEILPVILADRWLGLTGRSYEAGKPILVLRQKDLLVGIQVDAMNHVQPVSTAQVSPHPEGGRLTHINGLWKRAGDSLVTLIDGEALFQLLKNHFSAHAQ